MLEQIKKQFMAFLIKHKLHVVLPHAHPHKHMRSYLLVGVGLCVSFGLVAGVQSRSSAALDNAQQGSELRLNAGASFVAAGGSVALDLKLDQAVSILPAHLRLEILGADSGVLLSDDGATMERSLELTSRKGIFHARYLAPGSLPADVHSVRLHAQCLEGCDPDAQSDLTLPLVP